MSRGLRTYWNPSTIWITTLAVYLVAFPDKDKEGALECYSEGLSIGWRAIDVFRGLSEEGNAGLGRGYAGMLIIFRL